MIVYNYSEEPIFIHVGIVPDPNGGPVHSETTLLLHPGGNGGIDLCAYGMFTAEEWNEIKRKEFDENLREAKEIHRLLGIQPGSEEKGSDK